MPSSKVTTKGQVTIPKEIRDHLHVRAGDRLDFVVDESGRVVVQAIRSRLDELWGLLHEPGRRAVSLEEMDAAIAREHGRR